MTQLTEAEILEAKRLAEAATPGESGCLCSLVVTGPGPDEWQPTYEMWLPGDEDQQCECDGCWARIQGKDGDFCISEYCDDTCSCPSGDRSLSAFIAAARTLVPALADDLLAARVEVEALSRQNRVLTGNLEDADYDALEAEITAHACVKRLLGEAAKTISFLRSVALCGEELGTDDLDSIKSLMEAFSAEEGA